MTETKNFSLPQARVTLMSDALDLFESFADTSTSASVEHTVTDRCILVLGGRAPGQEWLRELCDHATHVWAVDKGTDACRAAGIIPERVIGDLDSVSCEGREWAVKNKILSERDIYPSEKDDTDFQLALKLSSSREFIVTGCWGGRFDHAFYNLLVARQAYDHGRQILCMADDREVLVLLNTAQALKVKINFFSEPMALSLLPLTDEATGVTVTGVRWSLNNATLPNCDIATVSNRLLDSTTNPAREVTVSLATGALGVYAAFQARRTTRTSSSR